jgi:hypothetical protein
LTVRLRPVYQMLYASGSFRLSHTSNQWLFSGVDYWISKYVNRNIWFVYDLVFIPVENWDGYKIK